MEEEEGNHRTSTHHHQGTSFPACGLTSPPAADRRSEKRRGRGPGRRPPCVLHQLAFRGAAGQPVPCCRSVVVRTSSPASAARDTAGRRPCSRNDPEGGHAADVRQSASERTSDDAAAAWTRGGGATSARGCVCVCPIGPGETRPRGRATTGVESLSDLAPRCARRATWPRVQAEGRAPLLND